MTKGSLFYLGNQRLKQVKNGVFVSQSNEEYISKSRLATKISGFYNLDVFKEINFLEAKTKTKREVTILLIPKSKAESIVSLSNGYGKARRNWKKILEVLEI